MFFAKIVKGKASVVVNKLVRLSNAGLGSITSSGAVIVSFTKSCLVQ